MEILNKINEIKTNKELLDFKSKINEAIEKRQKFISLCEVAEEKSTKSFGYIKEAFENISPDLYNKKGGIKLMGKYVRTIKESKNLNTLNSLYENIRKANAEGDVDFFIKTISETEWNVNNQVNEDVLKLGRILAEGILLIGESAIQNLPEEKKSLDNAIKFLSENKKTKNNIAEYSNAIKIIREQVNNNQKQNVFEKVDIDSFSEKLLEAFNKKYSNLTPEEISIIKKINISENKEEVFNQYKNDCLSKLSSFIEKGNNDSEKIAEVYYKLKNKTFIAENIGIDICGFAELTKLFE